jgi:CRISPR/Cas system-associated exonuclease Cas4 (RecB family)
MKDDNSSAESEQRLSGTEINPLLREVTTRTTKTRSGDDRQPPQSTTEPKQLKVVVRVAPAETPSSEPAKPVAQISAPPVTRPPLSQDADLRITVPPETSERKVLAGAEPQQIPARMMNEFVYCQRLFYYEFVEGVFVESADTLRGGTIHQRVDSGNGALPAAKKKSKAEKTTKDQPASTGDASTKEPEAQDTEPEKIHSRPVQMGSDRLGIVAKMDLVESKTEQHDLLSALEVCPVDYKAGAPKEGEDANELWDTDKMQLGLQSLILRDNGYTCNEGVIYYRATKQRVRLPITPELENWILQTIADAKRVIAEPIPAPLVHSSPTTNASGRSSRLAQIWAIISNSRCSSAT